MMISSAIRTGGLIVGAAFCLAFGQDANRDMVYTKTDMAGIVERVTSRTGSFKDDFDKAVSRTIPDTAKMRGQGGSTAPTTFMTPPKN